MKTQNKIYQVQGTGKAHYVSAASKDEAIKAAKEVYPIEKINFAADFTSNFSDEEKNNLPDYVLLASEILKNKLWKI